MTAEEKKAKEAEEKAEKERKEAEEAERKAMAESKKAFGTMFVKPGVGNIHLHASAFINSEDSAVTTAKRKEGMVYFGGEKLPAGIKSSVLTSFRDRGLIIGEAEFKKLQEEKEKLAKAQEAELKR